MSGSTKISACGGQLNSRAFSIENYIHNILFVFSLDVCSYIYELLSKKEELTDDFDSLFPPQPARGPIELSRG